MAISKNLVKKWDTCKIGTISETYIALDLLSRGFEPYMPLPGRSAKYDMLAICSETGEVFPVSVKSRTVWDEESRSSIQPDGDREAYRDGAVIAQVRYRAPHGFGMRLGDEIGPTEISAHRKIKPKKLCSIEKRLLEVIETIETGTILTSQTLLLLSGLPSGSFTRGTNRLMDKGLIRRVKWGHWEVTRPDPVQM